MNPAGPVHDDLITYLTNWSVLAASKESILVTSQTGLNLAELNSRPEPDLLWLRRARYRERHPSATDVKLAIEVADGSLLTDLHDKATLYAEAGIIEYWIVDASGFCIHVFRQPQGATYTDRSIANRGEKLSPLAAKDAVLDLDDLFGVD